VRFLRALRRGGLEPGSSKTRVKAGLDSRRRSCRGVLAGLWVIWSSLRMLSDNMSRNSPARLTSAFRLLVSKCTRELPLLRGEGIGSGGGRWF